jgi:phosphoglycolate phosphatase-like HAD superfamily hydrolase
MIERGLIVDFDDTLVDTRRHRRSLLLNTLHKHGFSVDDSKLAQCWGLPFKQLVTTLARGLEYESFVEAYRCAMLSQPPIVNPGARELLLMFQSAGQPVVLISSSIRSLVIQDLAMSGLLDLIDSCWCADDSSLWKPDPEVLAPALRFFDGRQIGRGSIIYVGDGISDAKVAFGNSVRFLAVTTGLSSREDFEVFGVAARDIYPSLLDLIDGIASARDGLETARRLV